MALNLDDFFDENEREHNRQEQPQEQSGQKPAGNTDEDDFEEDFITPDSQRRRRLYLKIGFSAAVAIVLFFTVRVLFFSPAASKGMMRGYAISLEKTGVMFDSFEGIFILDSPTDTMPVRFSTTNWDVANRIFHAMSTDSLLVLTYRRYNKALPWRGSSPTIVYEATATTPTPKSVAKPKPLKK